MLPGQSVRLGSSLSHARVRFSKQVARLAAAVAGPGFAVASTCVRVRRRPGPPRRHLPRSAGGGAGGTAAGTGCAEPPALPPPPRPSPGSVLTVPADTGYFGVACAIWFPWQKGRAGCTD